MKYLLIHTHTDEARWEDGVEERLNAWLKEMDSRGIDLDGGILTQTGSRLVRGQGADAVVTDGPYAETKEQVAGFNLIEAADLDEAIAVASSHPTTEAGSIEIRPVAPGMPTPYPHDPLPDKTRYLMFVCWDQSEDTELTQADFDNEQDDPMAGWIEETGERRLHGWQLQPPSLATTVRRIDGQVTVTDGPFAETKEQIGGYDLLECTDLDEAISIAASHGSGTREVQALR